MPLVTITIEHNGESYTAEIEGTVRGPSISPRYPWEGATCEDAEIVEILDAPEGDSVHDLDFGDLSEAEQDRAVELIVEQG